MLPPAVCAVMPAGVDDATRPSGGNRYDRRMCDGLRPLGWSVHEELVPGSWPHPAASDLAALEAALRAESGGPASLSPRSETTYDVLLIDGMIASAAGALVADAARSGPVVAVVHMPFGRADPALRPSEGLMLRSVAAVVVTSGWTEQYLAHEYGLDPAKIFVIPPGVDRAALSAPRADGGRIVCIAAVTRAKGYDVLVEALAIVASRPVLAGYPWRCTCIGATDLEPGFVAQVRAGLGANLARRIHFTGPATGAEVTAALADSDLLLLPSRTETWGMVVTEALAHGIPVIASDVGGIPEALGQAPDGSRPGILVPPADSLALADAVQRWLTSGDARERLRQAASKRRGTLTPWPRQVRKLSQTLKTVVPASPKPAGSDRAGTVPGHGTPR